MPTPLLSIRVPPQYHDLFKQFAAAVRADPTVALSLKAALKLPMTSNSLLDDVISPTHDVRSDIRRLEDDVRMLSERLAAIEGHAEPAPTPPAAGALALTPAERQTLTALVDAHARGVSGVADAARLSRQTVRRALAGSPVTRPNLIRLRRFLSSAPTPSPAASPP